MRLRRVSHLVVSSVLASCGGDETHHAVTIPPAASASVGAQSVDVLRPGAMDVVPTDANARLRFVSMAEIVEALAPPDEHRAALYAIGRASFWLQRVKGPGVDEACNGPLKGKCESFGDARFVSIAKDGTVTLGTLADLDPARTHDAMIARARAEVSSPTDGVWLVDGAVAKFPEARVLTEDSPIAPGEEIPIASIAPHIARLRTLGGDARERAILALGLSAKERAALRASFASDAFPMMLRARMTPLARGWLVEIVTVPQGPCGGGSGYARIVALGSNVIVDVRGQAQSHPCKGRRPPGWELEESRATSSLERFFEDVASTEAASVDAFELVARELESFGAPAELVLRARAAARDEIRHAALMSKRACMERARTPPLAPMTRTPFEAALDNAVEGCVNESFAAIVARFQSRTTKDEDLAHEFAAIADDECAHGDLAWDIAAWLEPRLTPDERERVATAREHAKRLLVAGAFESAGGVDDAVAREMLGLPTRAQAAALAKAFLHAVG